MTSLRPYIILAALVISGRLGFVAPAAIASNQDAIQPRIATVALGAYPSPLEEFAMREIRRYVYLRTGALPAIRTVNRGDAPASGTILIVQRNHPLLPELGVIDPELHRAILNLKPEEYLIQLLRWKTNPVLVIAGGDDTGVLYGAYRLAEHMGVGFALHGDTIPDQRIPALLPDLSERGAPLLATRGILPFHDFPEGPDWWDRDDYLAIVGQLPKMRFNFIGFHTYPEGEVGAEPTVWIGPKEDVLTSGMVKSAYPARYFTTLSDTWQFQPQRTSAYRFGAGDLFERDDFGSEFMEGMAPWPPDDTAERLLFQRTGLLFGDVFRYARALGVRSSTGTEIPLTVPRKARQRLGLEDDTPVPAAAIQALYEGMFHRVQSIAPVDYYWFWSPESWLWHTVDDGELKAVQDDLTLALAALGNTKPAIRPVLSGWTAGPRQNPLLFHQTQPGHMILSALSPNLGLDAPKAELGQLDDRERWAILWLEDDGAMILPQLWAGRLARDVENAISYGCSGVIGLHWRTWAVAPNAAALSQATWHIESNRNPATFAARSASNTGIAKNPDIIDGPQGGFPGLYLDRQITGTEDDYIYQTQRYAMPAYRMVLPQGSYRVRLHFCELIHSQQGERIFDVMLQGNPVLKDLDLIKVAGLDKAFVAEFPNITVTTSTLNIAFASKAGLACLAAIEVEGPVTRAINISGKTYKHFESDMWPPTPSQHAARNNNAENFYRKWAAREFGPEMGGPIAGILAQLDGRVARPATWTGGPGGTAPDYRPERYENEGFADLPHPEATSMTPGDRWRYEYWFLQFTHLELVDQINKAWGRWDVLMREAEGVRDDAARLPELRPRILTQFQEMIRLTQEDGSILRRMARSTGDLGTITNLQQHIFPVMFDEEIARFQKVFGSEPELRHTRRATSPSPPSLAVLSMRTHLIPGESLKLKMLAPDMKVEKATFHWRELGQGTFHSVPVSHQARALYALDWHPPGHIKDLEYFIEFNTKEWGNVVFPPMAPAICQTVLIQSLTD